MNGETPHPTKSSPNIEPSWLNVLKDEFDKPYIDDLRNFLRQEKCKYTVYPKSKDIFNAFWLTPFDNVRVVILGQDPYHGPNQAHGLCFSVQKGIPPPPSLMNIFKELNADIGIPIPRHGCLTRWAEQGVFLLNTVLTVRARNAHSHAGKGWENFTDTVIGKLSNERRDVIFVLWGKPAKTKIPLIDASRHLILQAPHPSPYSANYGFFGCRHFSTINDRLRQIGSDPIDWTLSD